MPKIVLDVDDEMHRMLAELAASKGRSVEDSLEELMIHPVINAYFLQFSAPRDYFEKPAAVPPEEVEAVRREIVQPIINSAAGHRPEAIMHGLISAAYDQALALCKGRGWIYADQHAGELLNAVAEAVGQARAE